MKNLEKKVRFKGFKLQDKLDLSLQTGHMQRFKGQVRVFHKPNLNSHKAFGEVLYGNISMFEWVTICAKNILRK